jgi:hypothetical protein
MARNKPFSLSRRPAGHHILTAHRHLPSAVFVESLISLRQNNADLLAVSPRVAIIRGYADHRRNRRATEVRYRPACHVPIGLDCGTMSVAVIITSELIALPAMGLSWPCGLRVRGRCPDPESSSFSLYQDDCQTESPRGFRSHTATHSQLESGTTLPSLLSSGRRIRRSSHHV